MEEQNPLFKQYISFKNKIDKWEEALYEKYKENFFCRGTCQNCCSKEPKILPIELAYLKTLKENYKSLTTQKTNDCPFYNNNLCSIHSDRPVLCRIQGLPLWKKVGYTTGHKNICKENFSQPGASDKISSQDFLDIEEVETALSKINVEFCETTQNPDPHSKQSVSQFLVS